MILSPSQREPMSSSIDHITSTLDNGGMSSGGSRYMTGAFAGGVPTSQLFSSGPGFFPSGANGGSNPATGGGGIIGSSFEDSSKSPLIPLALKIHNLPRDVTEREFKVLFTFAHEFLYSEIHKTSALGDDGLPLSAQGIAYFKSYGSASAAQSLLDMRNDIFFMGPLKCEVLRDYHSERHVSNGDEQSYELRKKGSSRFVFSDPNDSQSGGAPSAALASNASSQEKPGSPRSLFPIGSIDGAISGDDMNLYSNSNGNGANGGGSANNGGGQFLGGAPPPHIGHPHMPPMGGPPPSGKSLLLESRDDDEFNTLVKDPVRFFARDSGFMGFGGSTSGPNPIHSSPPQGILGVPGGPLPVASSNASASSANNAAPGGTSASSTSPPISATIPAASAATASRPTLASIASQGLNNQASSASLSSNASSTASSPPNRGTSTGSVPQLTPAQPPQNQWEKRRQQQQQEAQLATATAAVASGSVVSSASSSTSTTPAGLGSATRQFSQLSVNTDKANNGANIPAVSNGNGDPSKVVVPYSPTNNTQAIQIMQNGGRVLPPANPADQNPPCNTLYVGNLPPDTSEDELKDLFSSRRGYKRLCFRTKANGPMCFVEFEDVHHATKALEELYGYGLSNSVKGGIRLSYSKNPLGVRGSNGSGGGGSSSNSGSSNGNNGANSGTNSSSNSSSSVGGNNGSNVGRYNRYHGGSVNYAEAASQGYMK